MGLGRTLTYVWLAVNIVICAAVADCAAAQLGGTRVRVLLLAAALALAAAYVVLNSESVLSIAAMAGGFVAAQGRSIVRQLLRRP